MASVNDKRQQANGSNARDRQLAVLLGEVPSRFSLPAAADWDGALPVVPT